MFSLFQKFKQICLQIYDSFFSSGASIYFNKKNKNKLVVKAWDPTDAWAPTLVDTGYFLTKPAPPRHGICKFAQSWPGSGPSVGKKY